MVKSVTPPSALAIWVNRIIKGLLIFGIILLLIGFVIVPGIVGYLATRAGGTQVGAAPEGFSEVDFTTSDNVQLTAWYLPPQNGKVIIMLHGAGGSREDLRLYTSIFKEAHYGVLALDLRGHGESQGQRNLFSWNGTKDVGAAVNYLSQMPEVKQLGGFGLSVGGETLLGAASQSPQLKAIVTEGATARSFNDFYDLEFAPSWVRSISSLRVKDLTVQLFSQDTPPSTTILSSIKAATNTRYLFIAAENGEMEEEFNTMFKENTAGRSEMWLLKGVGHTGGLNAQPQEYAAKVLQFFELNLPLQ